jgi:hypothetical protein
MFDLLGAVSACVLLCSCMTTDAYGLFVTVQLLGKPIKCTLCSASSKTLVEQQRCASTEKYTMNELQVVKL